MTINHITIMMFTKFPTHYIEAFKERVHFMMRRIIAIITLIMIMMLKIMTFTISLVIIIILVIMLME